MASFLIPMQLTQNDEQQQSYFIQSADKLWETMPKFEFYTIEDIFDQLGECKDEVKRLNGIINENITELYSLVSHNTETISTVNSRSVTNEANIDTAKEDITLNSELISSMETQVAENVKQIEVNSNGQSALETRMSNVEVIVI